jgi:hypothetical protein
VTHQHPYNSTYAMPPAAPQTPRNGFGTAGFVLGLVGLFFSFIPLIGVIAWPLVILGLIFSILGLRRASSGQATNKGLAIAGIVLSAIGLLVCILWAAVFGKAVNDVNEEANRAATITYEVTGDAQDVEISYTSYGDGVTTNEEVAETLPWTKTVDVTGYGKGASLMVQLGPDGGEVSCKVSVGGEAPSTGVASGPYGVATCSDF